MKKLFLSDAIEMAQTMFFSEDIEDSVLIVRDVAHNNIKIVEDISIEDWYILDSDLYIIL